MINISIYLYYIMQRQNKRFWNSSGLSGLGLHIFFAQKLYEWQFPPICRYTVLRCSVLIIGTYLRGLPSWLSTYCLNWSRQHCIIAKFIIFGFILFIALCTKQHNSEAYETSFNSTVLAFLSTALLAFSCCIFSAVVFVCATLWRCMMYSRRIKPTKKPAKPPAIVSHVRLEALMFWTCKWENPI